MPVHFYEVNGKIILEKPLQNWRQDNKEFTAKASLVYSGFEDFFKYEK